MSQNREYKFLNHLPVGENTGKKHKMIKFWETEQEHLVFLYKLAMKVSTFEKVYNCKKWYAWTVMDMCVKNIDRPENYIQMYKEIHERLISLSSGVKIGEVDEYPESIVISWNKN